MLRKLSMTFSKRSRFNLTTAFFAKNIP